MADDEVLVAGRVHVRLLGLGLLTLDAHVTVGPPDPDRVLPGPSRISRPRCRMSGRGRRFEGPGVAAGGRRGSARVGSAMDGGGRQGRLSPVGDRLARSQRLVGEASAVLAEVSDR